MPQLQYPKTNSARLLLLERVVKTGNEDLAAGRAYVPENFINEAQRYAEQLRPKVEKLAELRSQRGMEVEEKNTAMESLERYVCDFWEVLKRRIVREGQPLSLLDLYGLSRSGDNPKGGTAAEWIERATQLVVGDAKAMEAGYELMSNPSAAQMQEKRDAAQSELDDIDMADRELDLLQNELGQIATHTDNLIRAIRAQLNAALYNLPYDDIRRIKRTYGFTYYTEPEEQEEAEQPQPVEQF